VNEQTQRAINRKCDKAASILQAEKYKKFGLNWRKQFEPCPKGLVYTRAMNTGQVMSQIWPVVVNTPCKCHPNFTVDDCISYECES
jgi:hypothetical protein